MTALFTLFATLFLKPALIIAGAAVITAGLRRSTAAARHAVWTGAIIATVALPLLSIALPPLRIPGIAAAVARSLPGGAEGSPTATSTMQSVGGAPAAGARAADWARDAVPLGPGSVDRLAMAVGVVWLLGVLLFGVRRVSAEVRGRRLLRRGHPVSDQRLERLFVAGARASGVRQLVELRLSADLESPVVAGVLRPVILLPDQAGAWTQADLEAVLAHELGHVARGDCLLNLAADATKVFYWCNPFLHFAVRRMRAESERACDDRVLRAGAAPEGYAHLLLSVALAAQRDGGHFGAVSAMARPHELEARLLAVLDTRLPRYPISKRMSIGLAGLGILLALPIAALTLSAAPLPAQGPRAPEPDRLADWLARPASERLPLDPDAYRVSPAALRALEGPDSVLAQGLIAAFGDIPDDDGDLVRERAAWALAQARDGRLVEPLLEALAADDWRVRAYAAWALAPARDPRAVPHLIPLLDHPVWRLRAMAAHALRESQDPRAEAPMSAALLDAAWQVRVQAVEYFAAVRGPAWSEKLRPRLDDRHVAVRLAAQHALNPH